MKSETVRRRTRVRITAVSVLSSLLALVIAALVAILTVQMRNELLSLDAISEQHNTCVNAARQMQEGSTYLTEQARLFTLNGNKEYLRNYLTEVNETRRRELSLEVLREQFQDSRGLQYVFSAMDRSQALMRTELYAMRLMLETTDDDPSDWPQELLDIQLSEADTALSREGKILAAQQLVRSDYYQSGRNAIASAISAYQETLDSEIRARQEFVSAVILAISRVLEFHTFLLLLIIFIKGGVIYLSLIKPISRSITCVRRGELMPMQGAVELRELAAAYNAVFEENQEKQRMIRREAEHDPLTDLLNRRYFERTLDAYKQGDTPFALIIVDIDNFKTINDTFGHSTGDALIKRVASTLDGAFRDVDHVCRIGGDEFAVIVTDMVKKHGAAIREKINWINEELSVPADDVPAVSLSVGVAFADGRREADKIFEKADQALYQVKKNGRNGCVIY